VTEMSPDEVLRAAARLLRQGAPVEAFVSALDEASRAALCDATTCANQPAAPVQPLPEVEPQEEPTPCIRAGCGGTSPDGCCCLDCHRSARETGKRRLFNRCNDCPLLVRQ
jgi:hypothetical protein